MQENNVIRQIKSATTETQRVYASYVFSEYYALVTDDLDYYVKASHHMGRMERLYRDPAFKAIRVEVVRTFFTHSRGGWAFRLRIKGA